MFYDVSQYAAPRGDYQVYEDARGGQWYAIVDEYFDKLQAFKDKSIIKVVTGVRRCGKSTLMETFQDYLREQSIGEEQITSINFEEYDFYELRNPARGRFSAGSG